jgi:hypothetical protein
MTEKFEVAFQFEKVCPACSKDCECFEPIKMKKEFPIERVYTFHNLDGSVEKMTYDDCIYRTVICCSGEEYCKQIWNRCVKALSKMGEETAFRTVWGGKEEEADGDHPQV